MTIANRIARYMLCALGSLIFTVLTMATTNPGVGHGAWLAIGLASYGGWNTFWVWSAYLEERK